MSVTKLKLEKRMSKIISIRWKERLTQTLNSAVFTILKRKILERNVSESSLPTLKEQGAKDANASIVPARMMMTVIKMTMMTKMKMSRMTKIKMTMMSVTPIRIRSQKKKQLQANPSFRLPQILL